LGDYFKSDQLPWAYEWLIEELKLDPKKMFASVFAGDESAPKDTESIEIIKKYLQNTVLMQKKAKNICLR